ncbi:unnamed protein product [Allacma fusca]|uniref:C2H2-type domain-containing protein n=1 Tax=Allacma fusca TaxID=39272 RepID=A0A8J2NXF7_9HEXA|nr:unnamed protein product [Allacma fusca]
MDAGGVDPVIVHESPPSTSTWTSYVSSQCVNCCKPFPREGPESEVRQCFDYSMKEKQELGSKPEEPSQSLKGELEADEGESEGKRDTPGPDIPINTPEKNSFVCELSVGNNSSPMKISSVLNSIYRLNLEEADEEFTKSLNVCTQCATVLTELYTVHQKFDHLRSIDSYLSKQLQILDSFLQQSHNSQPIKCEVSIEVDEDGNEMYFDDSPGGYCEPVNYSNSERRGTHSISTRSTTSERESRGDSSGPWVRLKRMRFSNSSEGHSQAGLDLSDNNAHHYGRHYGDPYHSDVEPAPTTHHRKRQQQQQQQESETPEPPKPKKRSPPKERKDAPKVGRGCWKRPPKYSPDERLMTAAERNRLVKSYRRKKLRHPNPCWYCESHFETPEECAQHTKAKHQTSGDMLCQKCSRICKTNSSFAQHQKQCDQFKPGETLSPHICPHCSKAFAFRSDLSIHLEVHNEEGKYSCTKCEFRAKSQLLINNHTQRMHSDKHQIFKCDDDQCQSTFKTKQCMRIHYVNMHTEKGNKRYREQLRRVLDRQKVERRKRLAEKSYVCQECNIDFFSNLRLISHRKSCHNTDTPKNFVCDQCGKDFSRGPALRFHLEHSHSDLRPFICEHCGKGFKSSCNLKDHVNHTHSEEGRKEYNQKMRLHNQRRKLVAQALSRQSQLQAGNHLGVPMGSGGGVSLNEQNVQSMFTDPVGAFFGFTDRQF